jgi:ABC-type dipeptide/oligopeptide/nickel transport system permease component
MAFLALQLLFRRTLLAIPMLLCVSAIVFGILRLLPADPVAMSLPPGATAADYERLRQAFGLDRSLVEQYAIWIGRLAQGDLGDSIFFRRPVSELVSVALPATLELVAAGMILDVRLPRPSR